MESLTNLPGLPAFISHERHRPSRRFGELAQLGERLVCNQEVTGSSPVFSTSVCLVRAASSWRGATRAKASPAFGACAVEARKRDELHDDIVTRTSVTSRGVERLDGVRRDEVPRAIFDN